MPKYRVELTATRVLEIEVGADDLRFPDEELTDVVAELAEENAFDSAMDFRVTEVEGWDLTVEEIRELKTEAASLAD